MYAYCDTANDFIVQHRAMDPLTALGIASNVVQFVDFSREIISTAHDLYKSVSGATAEHFELEILVQSVQQRAGQIRFPSALIDALLSDEDKALQGLSQQCQIIAEELLTLLQSLKVEGRHLKWKSFYQALRSMKNKTQLESLQLRLDRLSSQMNFQTILRQQFNILEMVQKLHDENNRLKGNRVEDIRNLTEDMNKLFKKIEERNGANDTVEDDLAKRLLLGSERGLRLSAEQRVLRFLRFEGMDYRYRGIQTAHEGTFNWIKDPATSTPDSGASVPFIEWLKSNDNVCWISGKIGSGKSTLMKYLSEQRVVRNTLQLWAGPNCQIVLATFFLWNAGKLDLQKSQAGLLRNILYQVLRQCPSLIPYAYPDLWDACTSRDGLRNTEFNQSFLTVLELLDAIQRVFTKIENTNVRICVFIDGLDEYDGRPDDIIKLVEFLKILNHVKLCVSSRPWNEFLKAFGGDGMMQLRINEFTRKDIEKYVRDTLEDDVSFQEMKEDDKDCAELIQEIVNRSNGVFLWVRLVVQSLLEGVTNADSVVALRRRLQSFPTDLLSYFKRELLSVDEFYRQNTARFFQVTLVAHATLPLISYWFLDQDETEDVVKLKAEPWKLQRINLRLKQTKKRLNACCKGLLEIQLYDEGASDSSLSSSVLFNWRVDFSHRSVRDFLLTKDVQNQLYGWVGPEFDADIAVCEAILGQIKTSPQEKEYLTQGGLISRLVDIFQSHVEASRLVTTANPRRVSLIRELKRLLRVRGDEVTVDITNAVERMAQLEI